MLLVHELILTVQEKQLCVTCSWYVAKSTETAVNIGVKFHSVIHPCRPTVLGRSLT